MRTLTIHPEVGAAISRFRLPRALGFGQVLAPIMYRADYKGDGWGEGRLLPYGPISLDPASKVLHYAQAVFEGLKAFRVEQARAAVFRPSSNWERLNASARRMMMPELPCALFMEGLNAVTAHCESFMPASPEQSLYLRPLMFGTQPGLGLSRADSFCFIVIASPSEAVASGSLRVIVEREGTRASPGGTGNVKVSGNYGASLYSTAQAAERGFSQPLWLDATEHRYIEELSIMNFFAVIDGEIHTPELSDTILPGITRDSILELARLSGIAVHERQLEIDEVLTYIESGRCTEAFACGTAVILGSIAAIGDENGAVFELSDAPGRVATRLRRELLDIQEGRVEDRLGWMQPVPEAYYPVDR